MFKEINKHAIDRVKDKILAGKLEFYHSIDDDFEDDEEEDDSSYDSYSYEEDEVDYEEDEDNIILVARTPGEIKLKYDHFSKLFGPYLVVRYKDFKNILDVRGPKLVLPEDVSYVKRIRGTSLVAIGHIGYDRNSVFDLAKHKTPNRVYDFEKGKTLLPAEWYLVGILSDELLLFYDDHQFMVYNITMQDIAICDEEGTGKYLSIRKVADNWFIVSINKENTDKLEYSLINPIDGKGYRFTDASSLNDFPKINRVDHHPDENRFDLDTVSGRYEIKITDTVCEIVRHF